MPGATNRRTGAALAAVRGLFCAMVVVALLVLLLPTSAVADTVTLGPHLPETPGGGSITCPSAFPSGSNCAHFNAAEPPSILAKAPANGTITTWRAESASGPLRLVVLKDAGGGQLSIVAESTEETVPCGPGSNSTVCNPSDGVFTFSTDLQIAAGEYIGIQLSSYGKAWVGMCRSVDSCPDASGASQALTEYFQPVPAENTPTTPFLDASSYQGILELNADEVTGGGTIGGTVTDSQGKGVSGVTLSVRKSDGTVKTTTTNSGGGYSIQLSPGTYTVGPEGSPPGAPPGTSWSVSACDGSAGSGSCTISLADGDSKHADFTVAPHKVTISLDPSTASTSGMSVVSATITDQDANGNPVAGQAIRIEPPVTYERPALVCDEAASLAYPTRLPDGFILGAGFTRTTDSAGQIHLTVFMGTVAGSWLLEAGEPEAPLSQWGHAELGVSESGGLNELPTHLLADLITESQNNQTLANFGRNGLANVLEFLGDLKVGANPSGNGKVLNGVGFMPIWSRDPAGIVNVGVVLFANGPGVRQALFNYLDGKTTAPLPESQAVVIDIAGMQALHFGTYLAEHPVTTIGNHLYSLGQWENGSLVAIGENLRGEHPHIPIPARGRPHAGFLEPHGNEGFLYEYGPYPPFGAEPATRNTFVSCVGGNAGGLSLSGVTVTAHSPVTLLAIGPHGEQAGMRPNGHPIDTIPGAIVRRRGRRVTELQLPSGAYQLTVTGTGRGHATLVVESATARGTSTEVFAFKVRKGERGKLSLKTGRLPSTMRLGHQRVHGSQGVKLVVRGLPSSLAHGVRRTLALSITTQFGKPAAGVKLSIGGVSGANGLSAISSPDGRLSITVDPQTHGRLTLKLTGSGYRTKTVHVKVT